MAEEPLRLPEEGNRFLHEIARDRVATQFDACDSLDGKLQTIAGFAATFVGIALATLAVRDRPVPCASWALLAVGVALLAVIVLVCGIGYYVRTFEHGPPLAKAWEHALSGDYKEDRLYGWAADCYTQAYKTNAGLLATKGLAVKISLPALLLEGIALGLAVGNAL